MRGSASRARAIEISCRSPAESPAPPSRTAWSRPPDRRAATRSTPTAAAAAATSSSRRVGLREADVRGDRAAEEERILEHDAELAAVGAELDVAQVVAVDAHRALIRVVVAADELRERRLAVPGLADEREAAGPAPGGTRRRAAPAPCRTRRRSSRDRGRRRSAASGAAPGLSWISDSSSRMLEILTIAAAADCSCP